MKRRFLYYLLGAATFTALVVLVVVLIAEVERRTIAFTTQVASGAQKLFESGQREEARGALEEALDMAPGNVVVRRELAMQLAASGQTEEAITQLRLVLEASPRDAGAARKLAEMLYDTGDREEAITYLRLACDWESGNGMHWILLSHWLLTSDEPRAALGAARRAASLAPGIPDAHLALGFSLWETGDTAGAEKSFRKALAVDPGNRAATNALSALKAHPERSPRAGANRT